MGGGSWGFGALESLIMETAAEMLDSRICGQEDLLQFWTCVDHVQSISGCKVLHRPRWALFGTRDCE